jgi:two-component system, NtrC family, sensor histidine kinase HydH
MSGEHMGNNNIPKPFNLLRWFSIASLAALLPVAGATGFILSHFITDETLQRDASLTAQFIQNCIEVEGRHAKLGANITMAELLDRRIDPTFHGISRAAAEAGRQDVLDHIRTLPDVLLASLFARDGKVIWSTNPELVGKVSRDNDELEEAFQSHMQVAKYHSDNKAERSEQKFIVEPKDFFIENYIPLYNAKGEVVLVVEVYKEPQNLFATIARGRYLVWGTTLVSGVLVYLFLFNIIRRGSALLEEQQRQLIESDSLVFVGEMSTAIAHSLRNPLASIRSSAELALTTDDEPVRKNAEDIISMVDFLSKWIRELLQFSRPVVADPEPVDLVASLDNVLESFAAAFAKAGVRVKWDHDAVGRPCVEGNASLMRQALHSILANAVEAMPGGGEVRIAMRLNEKRKRLELVISDTGGGMSEKQLALAFKPFQTTKRNGLGVGLAMVKRVVERFGGAVQLASRDKKGTDVRLEFKMV